MRWTPPPPPAILSAGMIPERSLTFGAGPGPRLQGVLTRPQGAPAGVVVCHPHPRFGGDMGNPVVTAAARVALEALSRGQT